MFGTRGSSPAYGEGTSGFPTTAGSVPMPSGGFTPSVHNKSLDNVAQTVPSILVRPSSDGHINPEDQPLNVFREGDFVFALRETSYTPSYKSRFGIWGATETPVVTVQMLNKLLRQQAEAAAEEYSMNPIGDATEWPAGTGDVTCPENKRKWWQCPQAVSEWAAPFGVVLNQMHMGTLGGGGARQPRRDRVGINVVVSRRANVKNNFYSVSHGSTSNERWHAQSTNTAAIQYSLETCIVGQNIVVPVVMVSMVIVDDCAILCPRATLEVTQRYGINTHETINIAGRGANPKNCLTVRTPVNSDNPRPDESAYSLFGDIPLGNFMYRSITPIGKVLHSPPTCPTAYEALASCHIKKAYDLLKPMEIELGCP